MKRDKNKRWAVLIISVVILMLFILIFSPPGVVLWKSFTFVGNIFLKEEYRPLKGIEVEKIEVDYNSGNKEFLADIYLPKSPKSREKIEKAVIIYTPLARGAREGYALTNLAETFAKLNILVFIPFEKEKKVGLAREEDMEDVPSAFFFLQNFIKTKKIEKIGFFGISYGIGPVMVASADEKIGEKVKFIFSLGGYYDLKNALKFISTGRFEYGEIKGGFEPDSYTKEIMQTSLIEFVEEKERPLLYSALGEDSQAVQKLSKKGLAIYNILSNKEEEKFVELFAELPEEVKEKIEKLSPKNYVNKLNPATKLFIVHSPIDTYIPYTESLRFYDALSEEQKKNARIEIMGTFGHAVPQNLTLRTFFSIYLPNLRKLLSISYDLMRI